MTTGKKYDYRVAKTKAGWSAEITRRVTSKRTAVSKSQDGFASEAEALAWAKKELEQLIKNVSERSKLRARQHDEQ